jgi:gluconate kinase
VEVVIQCIKLKREIREGLKSESDNNITIVFEGAPEKSDEVVYEN